MKKKHIGLLIGCLIGLIFLLIILKYNGCIGGNKGLNVAVDTVSYRNIIETVDASGKIFPETEIKIKADVSGEIVELPVEEGDSVVKGQLLMKIDPVIYKTQVSQAAAEMDRSRAAMQNAQQMAEQAKAQFDRAQSDFERNKKLYQDKVISSSEFEQLKSDYLAAKASYQAAKANVSGSRFGVDGAQANLTQSRESLNRTVIKAPSSGIISQLLVKNGERVVGTQQMDGTQVLTIADLGKMEVQVDVSETDIPKVAIGDTTLISVDAYRGEKFKGVVSKIAVSSVSLNNSAGGATSLASSGTTDEVTNYTVHILILPGSYRALQQKLGEGKFVFKPGMSAGVEIQTERVNQVLAVPINAVTTRNITSKDSTNVSSETDKNDGLQTVVFVFDQTSGKVHVRAVKTGVQDNETIQILSGLKKGERVVIAPYSAIARVLEDGTSVSPVPKEELYQSEGSD